MKNRTFNQNWTESEVKSHIDGQISETIVNSLETEYIDIAVIELLLAALKIVRKK